MISTSDLELLERYIDGTLADQDLEQLRSLLLGSAEARARLRSLATIDFGLQDIAAGGNPLGEDFADSRDGETRLQRLRSIRISRDSLPNYAKTLLAVAATTVIALSASLYLQNASIKRRIAEMSESILKPVVEVKGLGGSVFWTGNGGEVTSDLAVGDSLMGGTIEGATPGSWVVLEFVDGSTVMIAGASMLTYADHGQKVLHLKDGSVSADVIPQPSGKPMLVYTRSARLEVLGTQFKVETDATSTLLDVNKGKVSLKRLSDDRTVDVSANQRVFASAESKLQPAIIPESVAYWTSNLQMGPDGTMGKWFPKTDHQDAKLKSIPYTQTTSQGDRVALQVASIGVSTGDQPPVILDADSQVRIQGYLDKAQLVTFGVTVRHPEGGFGGHFMAFKSVPTFKNGKEFDATFKISDFKLDPNAVHLKDQLAKDPSGVVIESFWLSSIRDIGNVELTRVELGNNPTNKR